MLRSLILFAHPALRKSRVQRALLSAVPRAAGITIHDLYDAYPDYDIGVRSEQERLLGHEVVIMQYPAAERVVCVERGAVRVSGTVRGTAARTAGGTRRRWCRATSPPACSNRDRLGPDHEGAWLEVIGVVADVRHDLREARPEPQVYYAARQRPWGDTYLIRTTQRAPAGLLNTVRRELDVLDAALPIQRAVTMRAVIGEGLTPHRLPTTLLAAFGFLALVLAGVGIYAMFANMAATREREFGVRMARSARRAARSQRSWSDRARCGWSAVSLPGCSAFSP